MVYLGDVYTHIIKFMDIDVICRYKVIMIICE